MLRELHQLSYDEIAESLELDLGTVNPQNQPGTKTAAGIFDKTWELF
ncbi:MAG: hypothetical protein V8R27_08035 [Oscillospiraceae bacterium]